MNLVEPGIQITATGRPSPKALNTTVALKPNLSTESRTESINNRITKPREKVIEVPNFDPKVFDP